jgi:hypothetical protein
MSYFFGMNTVLLYIQAMRHFPSVHMIHRYKIPRMWLDRQAKLLLQYTLSGKAQSMWNVETTWPLPAEHERNWLAGKLFDLFMSVHQFAQCNNTLQRCGSEDCGNNFRVFIWESDFKNCFLQGLLQTWRLCGLWPGLNVYKNINLQSVYFGRISEVNISSVFSPPVFSDWLSLYWQICYVYQPHGSAQWCC